ncbi:MAG: hypothetical protein NZ601_02450 [candidate division WOR-3 bacterium]|nr:hypothetical protein [candidate division WOR-3 bacterium]MCX7757601.1 hypothetical protein [candidate division WOR-3 bacterium]MDW7987283.1 hypothetical protein [candidate division WOR-3 bacterium]
MLLNLVYSEVDYTNWVLRFTITVKDPDIKASREVIEAHAKSEIKAIKYNSHETVNQYIQKDAKLLQKFLFQALKIIEVDRRYLSDGSAIYEYEIPLTGDVLKLLVPPRQPIEYLVPMVCPCCKQTWPENFPVPNGVKLLPSENENCPKYTGFVIDARNIPLDFALFPKVINEDGREVFSINYADPSYVVNSGLVKYLPESAQLLLTEFCGNNPLWITALRSSGFNNVDIVISNKTARILHSSLSNLELLEKCRVAVLYREK